MHKLGRDVGVVIIMLNGPSLDPSNKLDFHLMVTSDYCEPSFFVESLQKAMQCQSPSQLFSL